VRFWDASAIVPLLTVQRSSPSLRSKLDEDAAMVVWWASQIECASAIERLARENLVSPEETSEAYARLGRFAANWDEIDPSAVIREVAVRLLRVHPLRVADALQLAAAYLAADRRPTSLEFVTLDDRLAAAARREGFAVVDVASAT